MPIQVSAMTLDPGSIAHRRAAEYIGKNLRPEERYELDASGMKAEHVPDIVAACAQRGHAYLFLFDGDPVFVWGLTMMFPGVYGVWGFGTEKTRRAMPAITRWGMQVWMPKFLAKYEVRRIEARIPISSRHSLGWLSKLGMQVECTLKNYSVHGEDFLQLAFIPKRDLPDVFFQQPASSPASCGSSDENQRRHSAGGGAVSPAAKSVDARN